MPRAALDWRIAPEDDVQLHRALVLLGRELGASGIARAWIPGDSSRFVWRPSPGGHHLGTTRMGTDPCDERRRCQLPNASGGESVHRRFFGVSNRRRSQPDVDDRGPRSQTGRHAEEDGMKAHPRREFLLRVLAACGTPLVAPCRVSESRSDAPAAPQRRYKFAGCGELLRRQAPMRRGRLERPICVSLESSRPEPSILEHAARRAADTRSRAQSKGSPDRARRRSAPRFSGGPCPPARRMGAVPHRSRALRADAVACIQVGRLFVECVGSTYNSAKHAPTAIEGVPDLRLRPRFGLAATAAIAVLCRVLRFSNRILDLLSSWRSALWHRAQGPRAVEPSSRYAAPPSQLAPPYRSAAGLRRM